MNRIIPILLFLFTLSGAYAQPLSEPFGKVNPDDLKSKKSATEPGAEAEVIFDVQEIEVTLFNGALEILIKKHERIKIYNEKGLEEANIKIPYIARSGAEVISKLEGNTYNLGESGSMETVKLDKQSIYNKKIDNRLSHQTFTMPAAKAGSIIEYRYVMRRRLLYFDDWIFQRHIPVRYGYCRLDYPEEFAFDPMFITSMPYGYDKKTAGSRATQVISVKNVPAMKEEPYISSVDDYLQKVCFRINGYFSAVERINLTLTWPKVVNELLEDEDFGLQLKKNIPRTKDLDAVLQTLQEPEARMTEVHRYVRSHMTWDGSHSIWALDGVKQAWEKKKGNSGEINLILVNLLKDAGLKAYPILLSTRENGRINTAMPGYGQFNTVMAHVRIGDKRYVLDATDQHTPVFLVPSSVLSTEGLVINTLDAGKSFSEQDWGWTIIGDEDHRFTHKVNIIGSLGDSGLVSGEALVTSKDYARTSSLREYREGTEKFVENHFVKIHQGIKVVEFKADNLDKDSLPLAQAFKFSMPVSGSGDYQYFTLNMFSGIDKNPFIADDRRSDVFFGVNQSYAVTGLFTIPEGYSFEELPKSTRMITPDTSIVFSRLLQADNNKLQFRISMDVNRPIFTANEYPDFREFYKKMFMMLNEQVVVKKTRP
jgi:hypothetical protein